VVLYDLNDAVHATARTIGAHGSAQIDVREVINLQRQIHSTAEEYGRLDILVNCAGTCGRESFEELSVETWDRDLDTNLRATAFACQAAVFPHMRGQGYGRLINIASVSGKSGGVGPVDATGAAGRSGAAYASAKAGTINLTRWIARQVGVWGITANTVAPGPISSPMADEASYPIEEMPIPRLGRPGEVAAAVSYLTRDDAGYVTGTCLHVDGGMVRA
jgi:NAD(P)-dependent dehydrogenase (short-subunit alcohol dehydrogenase family)